MKYQYQKGFSPLITILLVVLGIGVLGGGYVLYKDKQQQKKLETQIQDFQNQPVSDTSDNTTPKVTDKNPSSTTVKLVITFPTAGAALTEGQTYNITLNNSISSTTHSVSLEDKKGNAIGLMPETGATILGKSISWKVPLLEEFGERVVLPGDGFRIRIFPLGKSQESYYSLTFSIVSPKITKNCDYFYNKKLIISCLISPDNKWIISDMHNGSFYGGIKLIETPTDKVSVLSEARYDIARIWFSDSQRLLGFTGTFPSLDCEGNALVCPRGVPDARKLVVWYVKAKTYTIVSVETPPMSYDLEWIIPDHTAYVYAHDMSGAEGDNFYYVLNIDNKSISGPTKNPKLR